MAEVVKAAITASTINPTSYVRFEKHPDDPSRKTAIWDVVSTSDKYLGHIRWHGPWRCYTFRPDPATIFNAGCMRDIALFCEDATRAHFRANKLARQAREMFG